eukprot:309898_1
MLKKIIKDIYHHIKERIIRIMIIFFFFRKELEKNNGLNKEYLENRNIDDKDITPFKCKNDKDMENKNNKYTPPFKHEDNKRENNNNEIENELINYINKNNMNNEPDINNNMYETKEIDLDDEYLNMLDEYLK